MLHRALTWWAAAAALLTTSTAAMAAPRPLSITVGGGVSLGAYEAGLLYHLVSAARLNPDLLSARIFTGASAGSVNALAAAMDACRSFEPKPLNSLLAQIWQPVGLEQLFQLDKVRGTAVFTRDAFNPSLKALQRGWEGGLDADCDVLVGMTVTRVKARQVVLPGQGMSVPRVTERVLLRLVGHGAKTPPTITNQPAPVGMLPFPRLPLDGPDANPLASLRDVMSASSAFPVAFAPVKVTHCIGPGPKDNPLQCTPQQARSDLFVDGGFLDNQPLGLAASATRSLLGGPVRGPADIPDDMLFVHVTPEARGYLLPQEEQRDDVFGDRVMVLASAMASELVGAARGMALERVLDEEPQVRDRLLLAHGHMPKASDPLFGFMGFFEHSFRAFDFWLGVYDAHRLLEEEMSQRLTVNGSPPVMAFPNQRAASMGQAASWQPFACLRAVMDGVGDARPACGGSAMEDFRILLQVSLERLYDGCARARQQGGDEQALVEAHCRAAMGGAAPPHVPGLPTVQGWRAYAGENDLHYVTRRLGGYRFHWADLGLPRSSSGLGLARIRSVLSAIGAATAVAQGRDALPVHVAAEAGLNALAYRPPRHLLHLALGPQPEAGWSTTGPDTWMRFMRLSAALGLDGMASVLSSRQTFVGFTPLLGLEFEPTFLSSALWQPRAGMRAGLLFSSGDRFGFGACQVHNERTVPCSRPVVQALASVSVLHILRLQLSGHWWPALRHRQPHLWAISPAIAVQTPLAW